MAVISDARVPSEGIRLEQPNTTLHVGANSVGTGTLYITERLVRVQVLQDEVEQNKGRAVRTAYVAQVTT